MKQVEINKKMKLSEHLASPSVAALSHSSELNGVHLTPHFTLGEMCKTSATGVDNTPSHGVVMNLKRLCRWLEMLRDEYNRRYVRDPSTALGMTGAPIIINSGYRSEAVNKAIGGVKNSNHLTGCAVDIRVSGMEQLLRYAVILLDISEESDEDYDELLLERSPKGTFWLHFAVRPSGNRRRIRLIQT